MNIGEIIRLIKQEVKVIKCELCGEPMVHVDKNKLVTGDLVTLKKAKVKVSNPDTDNNVCVNCEEPKSTYSKWHNDDDDSHFFNTPSSDSGFGGGDSGGFGGFGGGDFGGGGASSGF